MAAERPQHSVTPGPPAGEAGPLPRTSRWLLAGVAVLVGLLAAALWAPRKASTATAPGLAAPAVPFLDVTAASGIDFVHANGARGAKLLPETMGGGCAFFDYDGDGDPDLLLINGRPWESADRPVPTLKLYRNDGRGGFHDVTVETGLAVPLYGMGVAVGDIDGDGDPDLFVTAIEENRLFVNEGGRFRDATREAGVAGSPQAWSTSAGFFDYDGDGDLDLFVCNYVQWSQEIDRKLNFTLNGVDRAYGPPKLYRGAHSYLYRNDGGGRFSDVSASAGIQVANPATGEPLGKALGVTFADVDRDHDLDVFVANDTVQNFLFLNDGGGSFTEVGALGGVAFDSTGAATGAMGIDVADFANDGRLGVGIGNFAHEHTSLFVQQAGDWRFADLADVAGIGPPTRARLTFGLFFFDYDLDGRLDMLQTNGHLEDAIADIQPSQSYRQPAQLFWNAGPGAHPWFSSLDEAQVGDLARPIVGRGASYADIDGDGDQDVLLTQIGGPPLLVRNDQRLGHHWLRLVLHGTRSNHEAIGAWAVLTAEGVTRRRQVMPTRSYLSQVELPLTFGLGEATSVESLRVEWPDGTSQDVRVAAVDTTLHVTQAD